MTATAKYTRARENSRRRNERRERFSCLRVRIAKGRDYSQYTKATVTRFQSLIVVEIGTENKAHARTRLKIKRVRKGRETQAEIESVFLLACVAGGFVGERALARIPRKSVRGMDRRLRRLLAHARAPLVFEAAFPNKTASYAGYISVFRKNARQKREILATLA